MKIYVGNLSYEVTEQDLRQEFEAFGVVESVSLITDQYSGRSKGFLLSRCHRYPKARQRLPVSTVKR
jgi:hypothetical protein